VRELTASDFRAVLRISEALQSSLDLSAAFHKAFPLLQELVSADYGALAVSRPGTLYDYQWYKVNLPDTFLRDYAQLAERDFVRISTAKTPNRVLRDEEMLTRKQLERHQTYLHARETAGIEQVMAVMLIHEQEWSSGLSLYRDRRRPFSTREATLLQTVAPSIVNAVRNSREHQALQRGGWLEPVVERTGVAAIWLNARGEEVARTPRASFLLEHFFRRHERRAGRLPEPLLEHFRRELERPPLGPRGGEWVREGLLSSLCVAVVALPEHGMWALSLRTRGLDPELAARLSPRRAKIAGYLLRGLSSRQIAEREERSLATIKQQVDEVCDALGVEGRKGLLRLVSGLNGIPLDP
jgi:DNA-binding CsgD family transcriptional regulator